MVHGGLPQRGMKTLSSGGSLLLPGAIRDRLPSGAFEPDRESGPDARMQLCTAQRIVASAARWGAREGKSRFFPGVHLLAAEEQTVRQRLH